MLSIKRLLLKQSVEWDKANRKDMLKEIQTIVTQQAWCENIYFSNYNIVFKKNIRGVEATKAPVSDVFNMLNVWKE